MNPQIRSLQKRDVEAVYTLGVSVSEFATDEEHRFWPRDTLERFAEDRLSFVVEDGSDIVGFLLAAYQQVTRKLTWENMYISEEYRGRSLPEKCFNRSCCP